MQGIRCLDSAWNTLHTIRFHQALHGSSQQRVLPHLPAISYIRTSLLESDRRSSIDSMRVIKSAEDDRRLANQLLGGMEVLTLLTPMFRKGQPSNDSNVSRSTNKQEVGRCMLIISLSL